MNFGTYTDTRVWFSYATKFRTFSQKYEKYEIQSRAKISAITVGMEKRGNQKENELSQIAHHAHEILAFDVNSCLTLCGEMDDFHGNARAAPLRFQSDSLLVQIWEVVEEQASWKSTIERKENS